MRRSDRLRRRRPAKYSADSQTDSASPASTSDVSMYWPRPVRVAMVQRGEDRGERKQPGAEIGERHARP